jgi:hypothetical protein
VVVTEGRMASVVGAGISTNDERVQAIAKIGFTERQARFLVLVMRHAGVCVPRQYASFAGIAHGGKKCNAFFAKARQASIRDGDSLRPQPRAAVSRARARALWRDWRGCEPVSPTRARWPHR